MLYLMAYQRRHDCLVDDGQREDEDGHEAEVFVPAIESAAALEEGGYLGTCYINALPDAAAAGGVRAAGRQRR